MTTIKEGDWVTLNAPVQVVVVAPEGVGTAISRDGYVVRAHIENLVKVAPPEPDWANVPRGARVEVRDFEDSEWHPATYFSYAAGERDPHIAKASRHGYYMGWRYCRLVGGEHE